MDLQNRSRCSYWTAAAFALVATFSFQSAAHAQATFASSQNDELTYAVPPIQLELP